MAGYLQRARWCAEEVARAAEQHVYARRRRSTNRRQFLAVTAAGRRAATRDKHDGIDDVPIDARLIKPAERESKSIENSACRRCAVSGEHLRRAEHHHRHRPSLFFLQATVLQVG